MLPQNPSLHQCLYTVKSLERYTLHPRRSRKDGVRRRLLLKKRPSLLPGSMARLQHLWLPRKSHSAEAMLTRSMSWRMFMNITPRDVS